MVHNRVILNLQGVSFSYPDTQDKKALDSISLEIVAGEMVALLGPNGSGKSTLARLFNGLLIPTSGHVLVEGQSTQDEEVLWQIRQKVGMVFQNPDNQLVAALVEEELAFGMENLGISPGEMTEKIEQISTQFGIHELLQSPPHRLSGGQKQRVAIASVLAVDPEVLVLDEPTSMLDPGGRQEIMRELTRLKQVGKTIILVTHDMSEALMADRIVILEDGKIVLQGEPKQCFSQEDRLVKMGLEIPPGRRLAQRLKQKGFDIPNDLLCVKEWVEFLCLK